MGKDFLFPYWQPVNKTPVIVSIYAAFLFFFFNAIRLPN
jgi:hypothetical protein